MNVNRVNSFFATVPLAVVVALTAAAIAPAFAQPVIVVQPGSLGVSQPSRFGSFIFGNPIPPPVTPNFANSFGFQPTCSNCFGTVAPTVVNSTLINPTLINPTIKNSTLINPVIVEGTGTPLVVGQPSTTYPIQQRNCGTFMFGNPIPSPVPIDPYTGLRC